MSYDICGRKWIGRDGKEHSCEVMAAEGHAGSCHCDCGASSTLKAVHENRTGIENLLARTKRRGRIKCRWSDNKNQAGSR